MFLYEKKDKPAVLFGLFIGIISFRSFHERLPICKQESDKKQPKPFRTPIHLEKQLLQALLQKEEDINPELVGRPIIDISGWQLPSEIDYDVLSPKCGRCDCSRS